MILGQLARAPFQCESTGKHVQQSIYLDITPQILGVNCPPKQKPTKKPHQWLIHMSLDVKRHLGYNLVDSTMIYKSNPFSRNQTIITQTHPI